MRGVRSTAAQVATAHEVRPWGAAWPYTVSMPTFAGVGRVPLLPAGFPSQAATTCPRAGCGGGGFLRAPW
jgi:hypothetical protein